MQFFFIGMAAAGLLVSCSSLPVPGPAASGGRADGAALLRKSAQAQGNAWKKYRRVEVAYSGEWTKIATRVQPVLTDENFRQTSVEVYEPRAKRVRQVHSGPQGIKEVLRAGREISIRQNGVKDGDAEALGGAALVADAYTVFLFGTSWLAEHGRDFTVLGEKSINGERCDLVAGRLAPGFGNAREDHFIAWISRDTRWLRRFQFSLNGQESTRGADVDVVFSDFQKAPDGSVWPRHFTEHIQRPIHVKAHEWRMTSLKIE